MLLICDFSPPNPNHLLSLYDRMNNTDVTLVRRKYGDLGPTHHRVIEIPLTPLFLTSSLGGKFVTAVNTFSYVMVGSVVSILAALRFRCTIIHSHYLVPEGLVGLIASIPSHSASIATAEGSDVNIYSKSSLARAIMRLLALRGTVVSVSKPIKARLSALGVKSIYLPTFVDGEKFTFKPPIEKDHTLLFVGSLIEIKRPDLLVEAVAGIPREQLPQDFLVRIIGAGPLKSSIGAKISDSGLQDTVRLEGSIPHDAVRELMSHALIYVSASTMEGTSFALIEAMASGCVIIASDIPGNSAVIADHENGLLFREGDSKALSAAIGEAINDMALCEKLSRNARRTFESNFDIMKSAELLSGLYAQVESRKGAK